MLKKFNPLNCIKWYIKFYSEQNTIENRIFWRIVPLSAVVGLASVCGTILEKLGLLAVLSGAGCLVAPIIIAVLCYRANNNCAYYYSIFCIVINCILGPMIYLTNGGLDSGMPMYCFGLLLLCAFNTTPKSRHVSTSLAFFTYVTLFYVSHINPQIVIPIRESFIHIDITMSFAVCSVSVVILVSKAIEEFGHQRYDDVNSGLIASFSTILEYRNMDTGEHVKHIKDLMIVLLETANGLIPDVEFTKDQIEMIASATLLHDIGKVAIPDSILNKPGTLSPEEYEIIKQHPLHGCRMIETMKDYQDSEYYEYSYEICRHHHERYDGSGYPDGLKGEEIPLISQLASVADVYEALTSKRAYKQTFTCEQAADIILNRSPGYYSDRVLDCFRLAIPRFEEIIKKKNAGAN